MKSAVSSRRNSKCWRYGSGKVLFWRLISFYITYSVFALFRNGSSEENTEPSPRLWNYEFLQIKRVSAGAAPAHLPHRVPWTLHQLRKSPLTQVPKGPLSPGQYRTNAKIDFERRGRISGRFHRESVNPQHSPTANAEKIRGALWVDP